MEMMRIWCSTEITILKTGYPLKGNPVFYCARKLNMQGMSRGDHSMTSKETSSLMGIYRVTDPQFYADIREAIDHIPTVGEAWGTEVNATIKSGY